MPVVHFSFALLHHQLIVRHRDGWHPPPLCLQVIVVNNKLFPTVTAEVGDRIIVTVTNKLPQPLTIHWHGMQQRQTNFMDGVPAVTQRPIQPGGEWSVSRACTTYTAVCHRRWCPLQEPWQWLDLLHISLRDKVTFLPVALIVSTNAGKHVMTVVSVLSRLICCCVLCVMQRRSLITMLQKQLEHSGSIPTPRARCEAADPMVVTICEANGTMSCLVCHAMAKRRCSVPCADSSHALRRCDAQKHRLVWLQLAVENSGKVRQALQAYLYTLPCHLQTPACSTLMACPAS